MPSEKSATKDGAAKALWCPIFRAQLKRTDGVGELSLCKISGTGNLRPSVALNATVPGDYRAHVLVADEEGDLMSIDLCAAPKEGASGKVEDEEGEAHTEVARDFIKWMVKDHSRPAVTLRHSPFLPDILLSVSDWNFRIWRVGVDLPIFVSPKSRAYITCGAWSPTRFEAALQWHC